MIDDCEQEVAVANVDLSSAEMARRYDKAVTELQEELKRHVAATIAMNAAKLEWDLAAAAWIASGEAEEAAALSVGERVRLTEAIRTAVVADQFEKMRRKFHLADAERASCMVESKRAEVNRWLTLIRLFYMTSPIE